MANNPFLVISFGFKVNSNLKPCLALSFKVGYFNGLSNQTNIFTFGVGNLLCSFVVIDVCPYELAFEGFINFRKLTKVTDFLDDL